MPDIELVIARHEENLAWLGNVTPGIRITVYNKGNPTALPDSIPLPNHGREAHTYLQHILTRYHDLSPVNVFCQGHPFDHCSNFHTALRQLATGNPQPCGFQWLGFIIDWDDAKGQRLFQNWSKNEQRETLELGSFCDQVLEEKSTGPFVFYPGAQFIVTRERILSRPRKFYENALKASLDFPQAAHCFERTWDRIFGVNGIPEEFQNRPLPIYLKPIKRLQENPNTL